MRLKTKLVLVTTALTFAIVLALSLVFLSEILRQRIEQTADANDVLAHEVLLATRSAVENGLKAHSPTSAEEFQPAVTDALRADEPLSSLMNSILRYSPNVQDISVADASRNVVVSSDPVMLQAAVPYRTPLASVSRLNVFQQAMLVFGSPKVLDISLPLDRNGQPFLTVHLGVRSSLLKNSYAPLLRAAILFSSLAILGCLFAAAVLSAAALRPIEQINRRLEELREEAGGRDEEAVAEGDAVVRAADTIDRLGQKIRVSEQQHSNLQKNLNQMLNTLKDGVMLFTGDGHAVMASDAVQNFLVIDREKILNCRVEEIFAGDSELEIRIRQAFMRRTPIPTEDIALPNGRTVEVTLDFIAGEASAIGSLLTLHDVQMELELEQEIEVSRRLAAIGRLTAGVGHEVKNPINAMVVHLELLRSKLEAQDAKSNGAVRHLDILSTEMQRLDRVVQTLADFTRPMELRLQDHDLNAVVQQVIDLARADLDSSGIYLDHRASTMPLTVRIDADLIKQAVLNILINGVQAMAVGGDLHVHVTANTNTARITIRDHGMGIPPEAQPHVFDLYFTTKSRGSGIGLAMTYRIVQLHGGAIAFRSFTEKDAGGRGTEFTIDLPLAHKLIPRAEIQEKVV